MNILAACLIVLISALPLQASPNITVPCYANLNLRAGTTEQHVNFHNPESNPCYMKLTLMQDGMELWSSELIRPDERITEISLAHALSAGTYSATLKNEFFSLNDKTALNGLNVSLTLKVE